MPAKRDYKKEYREYHGTEEQKKRRAERNRDRKAAEKKHGKAALEGKEVDHQNAPRKGSFAGSRHELSPRQQIANVNLSVANG